MAQVCQTMWATQALDGALYQTRRRGGKRFIIQFTVVQSNYAEEYTRLHSERVATFVIRSPYLIEAMSIGASEGAGEHENNDVRPVERDDAERSIRLVVSLGFSIHDGWQAL